MFINPVSDHNGDEDEDEEEPSEEDKKGLENVIVKMEEFESPGKNI